MSNNSAKKIFLYSHGFATRADDNGLFSEITTFFPNVRHIMFEYDNWEDNKAVAATFSERVEKLRDKYTQIRFKNPNAEIDLICHSQGCNVAMLAKLDGINKTIMLAPPMIYGSPEEEYEHQKNKNSTVLKNGTIIRNRSSGDQTIIKPNFFSDFSLLNDTQSLCNQLCEKTELIIIDALEDTLVKKDYSKLNQSVVVKHVNADHDLKDSSGSRKETEKILHDILQF